MRFSAPGLRIVCAFIVLVLFSAFVAPDQDTTPAAIKAPVLLVHGLGEDGSGWGILPELLQQSGFEVYIIDFNKYTDLYNPNKQNQGVEDMVPLLARTISGITNKTGISQINIIAHSYGGIIVRAYVAGWGAQIDESFDYADNINKVIFVAVPSFGIKKKKSRVSSLIDQTDFGPFKNKKSIQEMLEWFGDGILDLALWFRDYGPTRGVAALSVSSTDDAVVDQYSASLDGELPIYVINHHITLSGYSHCTSEAARTGKPSIIDVQDDTHPLYELAESFFTGTKQWLKVGDRIATDPGYMIFDFVPSENFNPTKLGKNAVKLQLIEDNGSKKNVKLKQTSAGLFYALGVEDGKYAVTLPYENKRQTFDLDLNIRDSSTMIVKFDPANPGDDEGDGDNGFGDLNLPAEIKDVGSLARLVRTLYPTEAEALLSGPQMEDLAMRIRDFLADNYPEIERLNDQGQRYGYVAPYSRHIDVFYYVPTADCIDFVSDVDGGGYILEKLRWSRVPPPWGH